MQCGVAPHQPPRRNLHRCGLLWTPSGRYHPYLRGCTVVLPQAFASMHLSRGSLSPAGSPGMLLPTLNIPRSLFGARTCPRGPWRPLLACTARSAGADGSAPRPSRRRRRRGTRARGIHTARRARRPRPRPAPTDSAKRRCTEAPHNDARMQRSAAVRCTTEHEKHSFRFQHLSLIGHVCGARQRASCRLQRD